MVKCDFLGYTFFPYSLSFMQFFRILKLPDQSDFDTILFRDNWYARWQYFFSRILIKHSFMGLHKFTKDQVLRDQWVAKICRE